jgi:hypothetical protein
MAFRPTLALLRFSRQSPHSRFNHADLQTSLVISAKPPTKPMTIALLPNVVRDLPELWRRTATLKLEVHRAFELAVAEPEVANDPHVRGWSAKERNWVNYFAHGFLLRQCAPNSVLQHPTQMTIEVGVPHPRRVGARLVRHRHGERWRSRRFRRHAFGSRELLPGTDIGPQGSAHRSQRRDKFASSSRACSSVAHCNPASQDVPRSSRSRFCSVVGVGALRSSRVELVSDREDDIPPVRLRRQNERRR